MIDKKIAKKLALEISKQDKLLKHRLRTGSITEEDIAILSDIRDYFMLSMLKCKNPKDAETLVSLFEELEQLSDAQGDHFHEGFFFALAQLLSLKYEIGKTPGEAVTFDDFMQNFAETLKKLKIKTSQDPDPLYTNSNSYENSLTNFS